MADVVVPDVQDADSSPATVDSPSIADLTPTERAEWRKTGTKPARTTAAVQSATPSTPPADSSPAAPADPAASTEAIIEPASEPGTPTRKKNAESRKAELDAEIQERLSRRRQLEQEIAEYETRVKQVKPAEPAAPPQTTPTPDFPEFEEWLQIPGNESKGLGAYTKAVVAHDRTISQREASQQSAVQARLTAYNQRIAEATKDDPEAFTKISPEIRGLKTVDELGPSERMTSSHVLAQEIFESPVPYQVQRYLTEHPDELRNLLNESIPANVIRRVGALSAKLSMPSSSTPAVKTTTDAPPPPPIIGSRAESSTDDELAQAARSGDFRRYRDTANAADIARMKASGRR